MITLCLTSSINPHGRKMACAWHCCCACRQFCPSPLTPIGDRRAVKTVPRKPPMKLLYLEFLHGEVVDPFPLALALQVPAGCIAIGPARLCHCPLRCLLEDGAKQRCNHQIIRVGVKNWDDGFQCLFCARMICDELQGQRLDDHCCGSQIHRGNYRSQRHIGTPFVKLKSFLSQIEPKAPY